ncbi:uncharacterized protein LOC122061555 [Macadamia integrifolia]|uniref:uncharacterized protein LOC122061555 n=1 Tax=Macadamia integrifolia TaxID=60698 RepID=UPI001C527911|nr:uncharacterized protein LOC122061555 [Macadamia integrifolia]XP_042480805.1 uncharacterized protein LOC122061555 [Macadamia integrifolia]
MMSEASVPRAEQKEVGPNHFGYCMHEIVELFSGNEEFLSPVSSQTHELFATCTRDKVEDIHDECGRACKNAAASSSLFCDGIGVGLPNFQRERLKASLKECVLALNQEVDEMFGPVMAMSKIKSHLRGKDGLPKSPSASGGDLSQLSFKKQKQSSSPTLMGAKMPVEAGGYEGVDDDLRVLLENGGLQVEETVKKYSDELLAKVDDNLRVLLENGGLQVEETMKKYSDELFAKLGHMEQQLEELLDIVMSKSRSMTITEKQELHKLIQELPPKELDRVVEIVHRKRPPECHPCNEVNIDLEKEDNQTLWRMYYYVEAVASATKLASSWLCQTKESLV